jgi:phosphate transport system permease protein
MFSRSIDHAVHLVLVLCVVITILTTVIVVGLLGKESFLFFQQVPVWDFLFGTRWEPLLEPKSFGVLPLVVGTLKIVFGSIAIALPLGLMIATYLIEFASTRFRSIIKPVLEV